MNVQAIVPELGTHQLRSRTIATGDAPQNTNSKTTIDENLLSWLRYTRSRLKDSEISTDAVDQIDDELEATAASLNKKLQVSIASVTGSGLTPISIILLKSLHSQLYLLNLNKRLKPYLGSK